jgi:hypothetical protein
MGLQRALHELSIVIPGKYRVRHNYHLHKRVYEYRWPCGCSGSGNDSTALDVHYCASHHDLLMLYPKTAYDFKN